MRRPLVPRVAAPREPVDRARVVRRRAKRMDAGAVAAALEEARFDARQDSRHEDLADDVRGRAELAERERLHQLLADAVPGTVYDPDVDDVDDVVQAELAADAAAADAREAELREAARIAARADELQALRELGTLEQTEPRTGDEAVRDELTRRAGGYVQADIDAWLAPPVHIWPADLAGTLSQVVPLMHKPTWFYNPRAITGPSLYHPGVIPPAAPKCPDLGRWRISLLLCRRKWALQVSSRRAPCSPGAR
ncbi:hypothetical protein QFZ75_001758 [Streptomyces sp. V3I8]|nr:hypothetical protein [Streptomyces sp. V3I8]